MQLLQDLWNGILELTARFVIPDWGAVIALLPIVILTFVAIVLIWTFRRLRAAPPARRGKGRIPPRTPAGIHMPGPSMAPIFASIGAFLMFLGLVFGGWLLAAGVIALIVTLVGWLVDARKEYVKVEEADSTGHLENIPAPRTPSLLLAALAVLLVGAVVLQLGWLPPGQASGGEGTPVGEPNQEGEPDATLQPVPGGSAEAPAGPQADVVLTAQNIAFDLTQFGAPAETPFTIALVNNDAGIPHNVELKDAGGTAVFVGDIFNGVVTRTYDVPALPSGTYQFLCTVHPNMNGTATLQ